MPGVVLLLFFFFYSYRFSDPVLLCFSPPPFFFFLPVHITKEKQQFWRCYHTTARIYRRRLYEADTSSFSSAVCLFFPDSTLVVFTVRAVWVRVLESEQQRFSNREQHRRTPAREEKRVLVKRTFAERGSPHSSKRTRSWSSYIERKKSSLHF